MFGTYGSVKEVVYKGKDFAFVEFADSDSMKKALGAKVQFEGSDLTVEERESKGGGDKKKTKKKKKRVVRGALLLCRLPHSCITLSLVL